MKEATMTSKGQITIPQSIREQLCLKEGSKVLFIEENHHIVMEPKEEDGLKALWKLREKIKREGKLIPEKKIKEMIKEAKREWSKFE